MDSIDPDELLSLARIAFEDGDPTRSLTLCQKVYELRPSAKLMRKIERIRLYIDQNEKENLNSKLIID